MGKRDTGSQIVTVIINTFNDADLLPYAIQSVLRQSHRNFELLIFDNCSTDQTQSVVASISDARIKYVKSKSHVPLSMARNQAMILARGAFVAFLDSDDTWEENKLDAQVKLISSSNHLFVCSNFYRDHGSRGSKPVFEARILRRLLGRTPLELFYPIALSSLLFRTEAIREIGFNNESQIVGDYELTTELARRGSWRMLFDPLVTIADRPESLSNLKSELMVEELFDLAHRLSARNMHSSASYVACRAIEIGFLRLGGSLLTMTGARNAIRIPKFWLHAIAYIAHRLGVIVVARGRLGT